YLVLDEASMATTDLIGLPSVITSFTKGQDSSSSSALYPNPPNTTYWGGIGQNIFQQFKTVVLLKEQKVSDDIVWAEILERSQYRAFPDFSMHPWNKAVLVTPQQGVRIEWNDARLREHCRITEKPMFVSPAEDTVGIASKEPSQQQKMLVAVSEGKDRLPRSLKIAEGMRTMLSWNLVVSADLTNGTQGTINKIYLDPQESVSSNSTQQNIVQLRYPPALVLFRPNSTPLKNLKGLPS
ncbi:hypothetical protein JB92DRAFT_2651004, partial [Gautieria morchelliformis]